MESATKNPQASLFDMHAHLGFFTEPVQAAHELEGAGVSVFCATVEPKEYEHLQAFGLESAPNVRLGVGLHPWWLDDGRAGFEDAKRVAELAQTTRYISEVGLDFSPKHEGTKALQLKCFEQILEACSSSPHLFSIHAVQAATCVLDLLDKYNIYESSNVIFHWFSGSGQELIRARELGCYFSVNSFMLARKRGASYAKQIPLRQLLLETDLPPASEDFTAAQLTQELAGAKERVAELRGEPVAETLAKTSATLLGLC